MKDKALTLRQARKILTSQEEVCCLDRTSYTTMLVVALELAYEGRKVAKIIKAFDDKVASA